MEDGLNSQMCCLEQLITVSVSECFSWYVIVIGRVNVLSGKWVECFPSNTHHILLNVLVQVSSGKYPGLIWDDDAKTMFRIPWKHAGKQDFRSEEDGAIFKVLTLYKYYP